MHAYYNSDELKLLVRILNDILSEAARCRPDLSTDDIVQLVFALADRGERSPRKLRDAVLGASQSWAGLEKLRFPNRKSETTQIQKSADVIRGRTASQRRNVGSYAERASTESL